MHQWEYRILPTSLDRCLEPKIEHFNVRLSEDGVDARRHATRVEERNVT
jgi:hypothetical protein